MIEAKIPADFGALFERLWSLREAEKRGERVDTGSPTEAFDNLCRSIGEHPSEMREALEG